MYECMDAWTCACGLYRNSWQAKRLCDHPCWMRRWIRTLRRSFVCNEFSWFFGMSGMKLYEIMGFSRTAIMALDFGAPSFRVKTKTRQKISKPSHHLPSSPIISYLCRPYLPRWDWKPWTISQSSRSFATCLAAWSTSEGAITRLSDTSSWQTSWLFIVRAQRRLPVFPDTFWHVWDLP